MKGLYFKHQHVYKIIIKLLWDYNLEGTPAYLLMNMVIMMTPASTTTPALAMSDSTISALLRQPYHGPEDTQTMIQRSQ